MTTKFQLLKLSAQKMSNKFHTFGKSAIGIENVGVVISFLMNSARFSSSSKLITEPVLLTVVPCDNTSPVPSLPLSSQTREKFGQTKLLI